MDILITGSAGFVGSDLVPKLQQAGHRVTGIDVVAENHSDVFFQHDLREPLDLSEKHFDVCIHLASAVGGLLFNVAKEDIGRINEEINRNVFDLCSKSHCRKLIFFSSINVFEVNNSYQHKRLSEIDQKSFYAVSKAKSEHQIEKVFTDFIIIRPTNLFGKNQCRRHAKFGESHVIPDLLKKIDEQESLEVFGDGTQRRNFVHVSDVSAFVASNLNSSGAHYFNLRSDCTISIAELVNALLAVRKKTMHVTFKPEYMKYELFRIEDFDMSCAKLSGWEPKISSIADGLAF